MKRIVAELLHRFFPETRWNAEQVLWAMLIGAFVLSTIHLVTMFMTRWGERRVTGKALLFSLMLHFAFAVGIVTVAPPPPPSVPSGGTDAKEHRVVIRPVAANADREARNDKSDAAAAIWDRVPAAQFTRPVEPPAKEPAAEPAPSLERIAADPRPVEQRTPDLAHLPELYQPTPAPAAVELGPSKQSARTADVQIPKSTIPPRPDPAVPTMRPRDAATVPATDFSVERRGLAAGNSPRPRNVGTAEPATSLPESKAPAAVVADHSPDPPLRAAAAPRPTLPLAADAAGAQPQPPSPAGTPPSASAIKLPAPDVRWEASVGRLRSNSIGSTGQQPPAAAADYQPIDAAAATPAPQVQGATAEPLIVRRAAGVPSTYRLRKLSNRKANARQFGGNDASERAVEASLRWLASVQRRDGSWEAKAFGAGQVKTDENGVDRDYAGRDADSGVTALAILAFLGAGYTHEEGQYADNVDRALRWLIGQQQPDGNLGFGAGHFAMMYCHGIATYAVAEAYGMQNDPSSNTMLREPLIRGVRYILENQNPDGGWRYLKGQKSDVSMFGWQLMALKSAEIAGVNIPRDAKVRMVQFLRSRSLGENGGLAGYRESLPPSASMTAEALFCKQMLGIRRDNAASREAADYLLARLPKRTEFNEYYWYYGTLAMYQFGGTGWQTWNRTIREILVSQQQTSGQFAGSWEPVGTWAKYGGRIYSTALSTLCLEVYYRFLPLYQLGGGTD